LNESPSGQGSNGAARPGTTIDTAPATIGAGSELDLLAVDDHPLMAGIDVLRGFSDADSEIWTAAPGDGAGLMLTLAAERETGAGALWQTPYFNGQVIVVASGSLLSNHRVAESGGAQLLANVLRH